MFKRSFLIFLFIWITLIVLNAQTTSSPYTIFGVGLIEDRGFGVSESLGGTGIAYQSGMYLNNKNPASYSGIDSLSFLFELGMFVKNTKYLSSDLAQSRFDGNFRYLSMGFRINRVWASGIGIVPYSSVGYTINTTEAVTGEAGTFDKTFSGSGGINRFYWGNSFKLAKGLSAGMNVSYFFGNIKRSESAFREDLYLDYSIENNEYVNGLYLDYGLQYVTKRNDWQYSLGIIYGNRRKMSTSGERVYSSIDSTLFEVETDETEFNIPRNYGIGIAADYKNRIKLAADFERNEFSVLDFSDPNIKALDSESYSLGLEYRPALSGPENGRRGLLYYRLGANYTSSYLEIDNTPVNSRAVTFGLGIPVKNDPSVLNISFEYGINGTKNNGLIKEKYWLLHFNLTLHDFWFMKPKFR